MEYSVPLNRNSTQCGASQSNVVPRILNLHQDDKDTWNGLYMASHLREQ